MDERKIDFLGIGAAKSGTTWVAKCLEEHPQILTSSEKNRKELSFFNTKNTWVGKCDRDLSTWEKGIDWYFDQFPPPQEGKVRGEFTVSYLIDSEAYRRIKKYLPDVKLLVVLRNPVDMLYSLHHFGKSSVWVNIPSDFEEALKVTNSPRFGHYYKHLKKYYDTFPHENIHVSILDDLKKDNIGEIQKMYEFLGVDKTFVPPSLEVRANAAFKPRSLLVRNMITSFLEWLRKTFPTIHFKIMDSFALYKLYSLVNQTGHKYPPISPEVRKRVASTFTEDINKLEKLLGRDLSSWKA